MATATAELLIARNPATGEELGRVPATAPEAVVEVVARARRAQARWGALDWRRHRAVLARWWGILAREADAWVDLIRAEIGKPQGEALAGDVISALDAIRWTVQNGRAGAGRRADRGRLAALAVDPLGDGCGAGRSGWSG